MFAWRPGEIVEAPEALEMAADMELWPLRLKVIDAHPTLLGGQTGAAFTETGIHCLLEPKKRAKFVLGGMKGG